MSRKFWTKDEDERLVKLKSAGVAPVLMARQLGRPASSIYNRLGYLKRTTPQYPHILNGDGGDEGLNDSNLDVLLDAEVEPVFTKAQLAAGISFAGLFGGNIELATALLQRINSIAV